MIRDLVVWWCGLFGVTDPAMIDLALTLLAAGSLGLLVVYAVAMVFALIAGILGG